MLTLTVAQMKAAEGLANARGISYSQMMRKAGQQAASYLLKTHVQAVRFTVVLAGKGNNGGDGFVMAKTLAEAGCTVTVVLCQEKPEQGIAAEAYQKMLSVGSISVIEAKENTDAAIRAIQSATLLVDAIFGTGFHGTPDELTALLLKTANAASCVRVALDLPSGLQADGGECEGICFAAHLTLAFAVYKPVHQNAQTAEICGKTVVLDIGIPEAVLYASLNGFAKVTKSSVQSWLPRRLPDTHKGSYGRLLVIAGSCGMAGAAMMATLSAMRTGCGLTTLAAPENVVKSAAPHLMEAMTLPLAENAEGTIVSEALRQIETAIIGKTAVLIGCGLRTSENTKQIVQYTTKNTNSIVVLDADALNSIAGDPSILKGAKAQVVITPHIGEMARLTGMTVEQVSSRQEEAARAFACEYGCVTVLKSHRTVVAAPDGTLWINTTGNAALAKGGSGDVLAGMIASFAAQGLEAAAAAICAVWVHGFAADRLVRRMSQYSVLARDLLGEIPFALKALGL